MKKIILLVLITLFTECQSQKSQEIMIPTVDNKFEKFDIEDFKKNVINNDYINHEKEKVTTAFLIKGDYAVSINCINSFFKIDKMYYSNGNIKVKYLTFNNGSPIGKIYYFDGSGKIIKEENTDEGYDFGALDVVNYCEKNKINLPKGYQNSGYQTRVLKNEIDGKKIWIISYALSINKQSFVEEITLDGKTGKLLNKHCNTYINN